MNQKNRITYRFDRNGQSITEESRRADIKQETATNSVSSHITANNNAAKPAKLNVIPLYPANEQHALREISPWNSPFQEDIGALEQLIRNTDTGPVPSLPAQAGPSKVKLESQRRTEMETPQINTDKRESSKTDFFIAENEVEPINADKIEMNDSRTNPLYTSRVKHVTGGPSWFNVFLSVAGALATGALFGYLLLSLFTGATIWPGGSSDNMNSETVSGSTSSTNNTPTGADANSNANQEDTVTPPENGTNSNSEINPDVPIVSLTGFNRTYYMLQFGVFSNTEGRDAALAQLAEKGLASAAMTGKNDYRVYAGVAADRAKAQTLRAQVPELELYVKEVTLTVPEKIPFSGDGAAAQAFFEQTSDLVQMLDELALAQLEQPTLSPLSKTAADAWQSEHQKWTENAVKMRNGTTDAAGKTYLNKIILSINTAAKSMLEYDKKPSRAHLWSTQSETMKAVITQKEWFESISAL
ncbi:SPOR domain-containing protein [Paenibacillus prosopidis]|uniref:Sporulation related protein n=1 Tax=Paenibacillus prosopidis TaxID=630520 RepID=A0A368VLP1_9BACL|nr:SPOR domain-containing protein [Paenibacillus prosopidis]RCW42621.1 sporulation related protein [Paenibacillus prosopidis]